MIFWKLYRFEKVHFSLLTYFGKSFLAYIYILKSLDIQYFYGQQQFSEKYGLFNKKQTKNGQKVLITDTGP